MTTPPDLDLFRELWPEICAEKTTYDAAFAAVPYLIDIAARLGTAEADDDLRYLTPRSPGSVHCVVDAARVSQCRAR